jgi:hypothetical protein|tara:strand:+ start:2080 stop:2853 length:774 start_codon:yes stop_codon:yes gene_type:complete
MANQVAKKEDAPLAISNDELLAFAGQGVEDLGTDDLAIPFLNIIQSNSPQLSKREGKHIEGSEVGMLFNTVTNELFDGEEGVGVIPCAYQRTLVEWVPRDQEGGFVASHDPESGILAQTTKNERGQDVLSNGNYLANTASHYVILLSPTYGPTQAVLSMTSTQLKKSRKWNTQMVSQTITMPDGTVKPKPAFASAYILKTVPESNKHGNWYGYEIGARRDASAEEFQIGAAFYKAVMAGTVKAGAPEQEGASDNVPF